MFVGHYAGAFVAKAIEPRVPLAALVLGVQLVDVAWALLVLAGVERVRIDPSLPSNALVLEHMPFTHSLPATIAWAAVVFAGARGWLGARGAGVLAAAVASHWLGDLIVHRPDLPLGWTEPKVGWGLWDHPIASYALEVGLVVTSLWWCFRNAVVTRPRALLWFGVAFVVAETALRVGPPPSGPVGAATSALGAFVAFAAAAAWVERDLSAS